MKRFALLTVIFFLILTPVSRVCAVTPEQFEMTDGTNEERVASIQSYYDITLLEEKTSDSFITNFDVNNSGEIIIQYTKIHAFATADDYINVFDNEGNFKYGFKYYDSGSCYAAWIDGYAATVSSRGWTAVLFDQMGEIYKIYDLEDHALYDYILMQNKTDGEYEYTLKNKEGARPYYVNQYTGLTKKAQGGEEEIIIDDSKLFDNFFNSANMSRLMDILIVATVIIGFLCALLPYFILKKRKKRAS